MKKTNVEVKTNNQKMTGNRLAAYKKKARLQAAQKPKEGK